MDKIPCPENVEEILNDYNGRRAAIIKALTTDTQQFYEKCKSVSSAGGENLNVGLHGFPDGRWEVEKSPDMLPPHLPEPYLAINFARDATSAQTWLNCMSEVAAHSGAWLLSMAFYYCGHRNLSRARRTELFDLINDLPTVLEVFTEKNEAGEIPIPLQLKEDEEDLMEEDNVFWIECEVCMKWYHGKCVKVTPASYKHIKVFKCPPCRNTRAL